MVLYMMSIGMVSKLSATEKNKWREWCQSDPNIHIFMRDWWLDAVCGADNWDCIIESTEDSEESRAALPFYKRKSHGFDVVAQPVLTQKIGPYVKLAHGLSAQESADMSNRLIGNLLDRLPKDVADIRFNMDWHVTNGEPFLTRGYEVTTRYTTVIPDLSDLENVWNNLSPRARKEIRKAEQMLNFVEINDIDKFDAINEMTFERQNMKRPYKKNMLYRIERACCEHNARKIFFAIDTNNEVHGGVYVVYDEKAAYFLMSGENPQLRSSNAGRFMKWNAIKAVAKVTRSMDFEGSMIEGVQTANRRFGGLEKPYLSVSKRSNKFYNLLWHGKQAVANLI